MTQPLRARSQGFTFRLKEANIPLFGATDAKDKAAFSSAFASTSGPVRPLSINTAAMDLIADDLELDSEGLLLDAHRYATGQYRAKAGGLGGGRLGDFGEVLVYLVNRKVRGREIVRVVSWRAGGEPVKGNAFPQPDFLVREGGESGVLEVKSTEAFDYQELLSARLRKTIEPCSGIRRCREAALRQLGYVEGRWKRPRHRLVLRDGQVVPFPADFGEAVAVLPVDGRVAAFRGDPRYRPPERCRTAAPPRVCWACTGADGTSDVLVSPMRNEPGRLPLIPSGHGPEVWLSAYRRWTHAVWARELHAVHDATSRLAHAVEGWLTGVHTNTADRDVLRAFWGSYLRDVANQRGVDLGPSVAGADLLHVQPSFGWTPSPLRTPVTEGTTLEAVRQAWRGLCDRRETKAFSIAVREAERVVESVQVRVDPDGWSLTSLAREWWARSPLDDQGAARVAAAVVRKALELDGWGPSGEGLPSAIAVRRLSATVGDTEVHLGWEAKSVTEARETWREWRHPGWWPWRWPEFYPPGDRSLWFGMLAMGDPRVRLIVLPDGRARLGAPHVPRVS